MKSYVHIFFIKDKNEDLRMKFQTKFWTTNSMIKAANDRQIPPAKIQKIPPTFSMSKLELCV